MNPTPLPDTLPSTPDTPSPNPDTPPTVPVGLPNTPPTPTEPTVPTDPDAFWSPWPLPPRGNQLAVRSAGFSGNSANSVRSQLLQEGTDATPTEDLKYRGGRVIRNLSYVNLYVSGDTEWSTEDVEQIDYSLSAAMRDEHLNNVLLQYFGNQPISSHALPSHPLVGYTPKTVSRGDIQNYVAYLHQRGFLSSYDLKNTVFNFLLPSRTILSTDSRAANSVQDDIKNIATAAAYEASDTMPEVDNRDSVAGLGGYHGSVVIENEGRVYYTVGVYSERFSNGATNGVPVLRESWKNVVATLYHQLIETRTDPDVEDALRNPADAYADRYLGWVSDSGLEIGDFPLRADVPLTSVIREVPLANGSGMVPVQLPYSNFANGPEGPIERPHPLQ